MPTRQQVVAEASKHVGYREGPRNNETRFGARTGFNFQPWCGSFTDCVLMDVGFRVTKSGGLDSEPSSVYCPNGVTRYQALGRWIGGNGTCEPGDIVYFDFDTRGNRSPSDCDHVGIVADVEPGGQMIWTVEGNTSLRNQANGGSVMRRVRKRSEIMGFGRPRFDAAPPQPDLAGLRPFIAALLARELRAAPNLAPGARGQHVVTLQKALNVFGQNLATDGVYGPGTTAAVKNVQRWFNLNPDGVAGPKTRFVLLASLDKVASGR